MLWWFIEFPGNPFNPMISQEQDGFYADWFVDIAESITRAPLAAKGIPHSWAFLACAHLIIETDDYATKVGYTSWKDLDNPGMIQNWHKKGQWDKNLDLLTQKYHKVTENLHLEYNPQDGVGYYF